MGSRATGLRHFAIVIVAGVVGAGGCGLSLTGASDLSSDGGREDAANGPITDAAMVSDGAAADDRGSPSDDGGVATDAASDAGGPVSKLSVSVAPSPSTTVDLTAEGTIDWVKWQGAVTVDRKLLGVGGVSDYVATGASVLAAAQSTVTTYTWTNGTPSLNGNTRWYLYSECPAAGPTLAVSLDAVPVLRTARVYLGVYKTAARIVVSLSDNSAAAYQNDQDDNSSSGADYRYTIEYSAPLGVKLQVRWSSIAPHTSTESTIRLAAATVY